MLTRKFTDNSYEKSTLADWARDIAAFFVIFGFTGVLILVLDASVQGDVQAVIAQLLG